MRATFTFEEPGQFAPAAMARMLVDLDGLFFVAMLFVNKDLLREVAKEPFEEHEYEFFIYLGSNFDHDDPKYIYSKFYSKTTLERANYNSPPRITISLRAVLDFQKTVKVVLDFLKYILTLNQQKGLLEAHTHKERQEAIAAEINNYRAVTALLDREEDGELRFRLLQALVNRMEPLTNGQDYPRIADISTHGPFPQD